MERNELKLEAQVLIPRCFIARGYWDRLRGLMGRSGMAEDEALLFPRCNSVHTFFMRFPIDVVMVGASGEVTEILESLGPWRMLLPRFRAKHVIEMRPGLARELGIKVGSRLQCEGVWS